MRPPSVLTSPSIPTLILWAAAVTALPGCADTKQFITRDGAAPLLDGARDRSALWPDQGPLPDGVSPAEGQMMYAHSKDTLFTIDPKTLQLATVAKITLGPGAAPDVNDIAVTPGGVLYGVSVNDLYRIDQKSAALTH